MAKAKATKRTVRKRKPVTSKEGHQELILTVSELWKLLKQNGLDDKGYDISIKNEIANRLKCQPEFFEKMLLKSKYSIEEFLKAFFLVVEPYSAMMNDLLVLFEASGVKSTNEQLRISFEFGKHFEELEFDINHFKDQMTLWKKVSTICTANHWTKETLFDLKELFPLESKSRIENLPSWVYEYRNHPWPSNLSEQPSSGIDEFDKEISKIWELLKRVHGAIIFISGSYQDITSLAWGKRKEEQPQIILNDVWDLNLLAGLASDFWIPNFVEGIYAKIYAIQQDRENLPKLIHDIQGKFDPLSNIISKEELVLFIKEFLNLPIWKKRHELYSVWTSTQILTAIESEAELHHTDGHLQFRFSGTHLATFKKTNPEVKFWSELRSPFSGVIGKGRVKAIQPDYSLLAGSGSAEDSCILAIECKQYKKASPSNFSAALTDYARGRPNAFVVLVNYSKAANTIIDRVPERLHDRVKLIGGMRPGNTSAISEFKEVIKREFERSQSKVPLSQSLPSMSFEISIIWDEAISDLDLYLTIETDEKNVIVAHSSPGSLEVFPFAFLQKDVRDGKGPEVIQISQVVGKKYRVSVRNYSKEHPLRDSGAKLFINSLAIICPTIGDGEWWNVLTIDYDKNMYYIYNTIGTEF